jgi:hypothetical protein
LTCLASYSVKRGKSRFPVKTAGRGLCVNYGFKDVVLACHDRGDAEWTFN